MMSTLVSNTCVCGSCKQVQEKLKKSCVPNFYWKRLIMLMIYRCWYLFMSCVNILHIVLTYTL